jgi:predicted XRE-type DNA-binding protein
MEKGKYNIKRQKIIYLWNSNVRITQAEIARRFGVSRQYVNQVIKTNLEIMELLRDARIMLDNAPMPIKNRMIAITTKNGTQIVRSKDNGS